VRAGDTGRAIGGADEAERDRNLRRRGDATRGAIGKAPRLQETAETGGGDCGGEHLRQEEGRSGDESSSEELNLRLGLF
jgi:hypothetical protein